MYGGSIYLLLTNTDFNNFHPFPEWKRIVPMMYVSKG